MRRAFAAYVAFAERRAGRLVAGFGLLALLALGASLRLELHSDMAELLPDQHPAVRALRGIAGRQKSASNLVLLVVSPDAEANRRFADALRPSLDGLVGRAFTEVKWRPDSEVPDFARRWRWLYADVKDLTAAEELLDRIISRRGSPFAVDLKGDPEAELRALRERLEQKLPPSSDKQRFEGPIDGPFYLGVMLWRQNEGFASAGDIATLREVKGIVQRLDPKRFHPEMHVELTGGIAAAVDEQEGIRDDLLVVTGSCATLVLLVIWLYFRRGALLIVIGSPAVLGLLLALALASFTIHHLNLNTAFLLSIILGNGINSPIVLLARYGEERRAGREVTESLTTALSTTLWGTLVAMSAASLAYGSLLFTSFRGFNQFGLVGGAGMLLVWTMSFLLVPPMVILGERWRPGLLTPRGNLWRGPFRWLGGLAARRPWLLVGTAAIGLAVASVPLSRWLHDPLEWNFDHLRSDDTPSRRMWRQMELLGMSAVGAGYIGNNGVLLVERPEQADVVAEALRAADRARGDAHVLAEVRTLSSKLPDRQEEKLAILARVRDKIDRHRELLAEAERKEAAEWRPPDYLRAIGIEDLPRQVREAFTETDGQRGRLIGIDADYSRYTDWNGHDLLRMAKALRVEALGRSWVAASAATIFAGMIESIVADGPLVTLAALAGVSLLVLLAFGVRGGALVLAALGVGVVWLGGLGGALGIKINFMNFVALPITLGVGADYAANIWARLRSDRDLVEVVGETGSAVALCSLTTIIGYSSLLFGRNPALRSFGALADLGEIACLAAALVVLPALVRLLRHGD